MAVVVGANITVLSRVGEELIPEHGRITGSGYTDRGLGHSQREYRYWFAWTNGEATSMFAAEDGEGVRWIYGHHARDSAAVRALEVAYALARAA